MSACALTPVVRSQSGEVGAPGDPPRFIAGESARNIDCSAANVSELAAFSLSPSRTTLFARTVMRSAAPRASRRAASVALDGKGMICWVTFESRYPSIPATKVCVHRSPLMSFAVAPAVYSCTDCGASAARVVAINGFVAAPTLSLKKRAVAVRLLRAPISRAEPIADTFRLDAPG